ncbi:TPA: hypothetical protein NPQ05_002666 [Klebsiella quasipneumoniae subsp. quasipneumoniae]|nr:hypothetical protein [Klebsiella quasipneumoniae subsp. quasipneumoniae]HCI6990201.1 hypothetical protein [Klebsiella quasipneumoniae subsp. quasipneumoniae]
MVALFFLVKVHVIIQQIPNALKRLKKGKRNKRLRQARPAQQNAAHNHLH